MSVRDLLSPFTAWKNIFREPVSIKDPFDRDASDRYRGFHQNDIAKCIGCGTCEAICQNAAIDMVPVEGLEGIKTQDGDSGLRPRIDYGRCCWCALCVDVCMTSSLTMSNEYKWVESDPDKFCYIPGVDKKHWDDYRAGYERPAGHQLHSPERIEMPELEPDERIDSFVEIVGGYSVEQARLEADRCVTCGICVATCPAHMPVPEYITAIRDGDYEHGLALLYESNPFSQICGKVCTRKCETSCAAAHEGDPIAIRWLKRHITEQVPFERYRDIIGDPLAATGRKIAIVGAGPAGMTAAFDLARKGHAVTVYEGQDHAGGMTRYGIPEYRLPFDTIQREIDVIVSMGVEMRYNTRVGEDVSLSELRQEYDAVMLAIGLWLGRSTRIPGSDHPDVTKAVDLLRRIREGEALEAPKQLVVIGGGNVAMDIARSMARLQKQQHGQVGVTLTALEDRAHFLADPDEIKEAHEEGITILPSRGPQRCVIDGDRLIGLETAEVLSIFDEQHRFAPRYNLEDTRLHEGDMVIEAIGQMSDSNLLGEELTEALDWQRGRIAVDEAGRTSEPWLWSGGDMVNGPDVVHAVADGHRAAASIHDYLEATANQGAST